MSLDDHFKVTSITVYETQDNQLHIHKPEHVFLYQGKPYAACNSCLQDYRIPHIIYEWYIQQGLAYKPKNSTNTPKTEQKQTSQHEKKEL